MSWGLAHVYNKRGCLSLTVLAQYERQQDWATLIPPAANFPLSQILDDLSLGKQLGLHLRSFPCFVFFFKGEVVRYKRTRMLQHLEHC